MTPKEVAWARTTTSFEPIKVGSHDEEVPWT
jgi:hypothetical protein